MTSHWQWATHHAWTPYPFFWNIQLFLWQCCLFTAEIFSVAHFHCVLMAVLLFDCFSSQFSCYTTICFLYMLISCLSPSELGNMVSFAFSSVLHDMYVSIVFPLGEVWAVAVAECCLHVSNKMCLCLCASSIWIFMHERHHWSWAKAQQPETAHCTFHKNVLWSQMTRQHWFIWCRS